MFCVHCGKEISEEAVICPCCGKIVNEEKIAEVVSRQENPMEIINDEKLTLTDEELAWNKPTTLATVAMGFTITGCVFDALWTVGACAYAVIFESFLWLLALIPFVWCLSMTICFCSMVKNGEKMSVEEKIFLLLFVNLIAGILMLCDRDN